MTKKREPKRPGSKRKSVSSKKPSSEAPASGMVEPSQSDGDRLVTAGKRADGRFAPGTKPGPGRPKGSRNRVTKMVESILEGEAEAMTKQLVTKAKAGSTEAMKIVFAILAPPRKDRLVEIALPDIVTGEDLVDAHSVIIRAVAKGQISPSEAHAIAALLDFRRRAVEAVDLEERLMAMEARLGEQEAFNATRHH